MGFMSQASSSFRAKQASRERLSSFANLKLHNYGDCQSIPLQSCTNRHLLTNCNQLRRSYSMMRTLPRKPPRHKIQTRKYFSPPNETLPTTNTWWDKAPPNIIPISCNRRIQIESHDQHLIKQVLTSQCIYLNFHCLAIYCQVSAIISISKKSYFTLALQQNLRDEGNPNLSIQETMTIFQFLKIEMAHLISEL